MTVTIGDVKTMHVLADAILAIRDRVIMIGPGSAYRDAEWHHNLDRMLAECANLADAAEDLARLVKALPCP